MEVNLGVGVLVAIVAQTTTIGIWAGRVQRMLTEHERRIGEVDTRLHDCEMKSLEGD